MGLYRAGFDVLGVDIKPQPRYPAFHQAKYARHFRFVQADALTFPLEGFDFIWASPPCQGYTSASYTHRKKTGAKYPMLISEVRQRLEEAGIDFCIENVPSAPLRAGSIKLCGLSFGLPLLRHRLFENSFCLMAPPHIRHQRGAAIRREIFTVFGKAGSLTNRNRNSIPYSTARIGEAQLALGIDWMSYHEMAESIPPAYAEFIGRQVIR